jgi:hypothetical protein
MNLGVGGKHLLDQRGARAWQAEHEDRPARLRTQPAKTAKQLRREGAHQGIDKLLVLGRFVFAPSLGRGQGQLIGLAQTGGGAGVFAAAIEDLGQCEAQLPLRMRSQLRNGQKGLQCRQINVPRLAP